MFQTAELVTDKLKAVSKRPEDGEHAGQLDETEKEIVIVFVADG